MYVHRTFNLAQTTVMNENPSIIKPQPHAYSRQPQIQQKPFGIRRAPPSVTGNSIYII